MPGRVVGRSGPTLRPRVCNFALRTRLTDEIHPEDAMRGAIWPLFGAAVLACSGGSGGSRAGSGDDTNALAGAEPVIRAVDTTMLTDPQGLGTDRPARVAMPPAGGAVAPGTAYPPGAYPPPAYPTPAPMPAPSADVPVVMSPPTPPIRRNPPVVVDTGAPAPPRPTADPQPPTPSRDTARPPVTPPPSPTPPPPDSVRTR